MKILNFTISVLVFLISGVMCLFLTSEVHAQNNARREFKFHQENIRAKKRNNDLQKARQGNKRSNLLKNYKPRRLRFFLDKRENTRTSPQLEGIEETNNFFFIIYFKIMG